MLKELVVEVVTPNYTHMDAVRVNNALTECGVSVENMVYHKDTVLLEVSLESEVPKYQKEIIHKSIVDIVLGNYDILPVNDGCVSSGSEDFLDNNECSSYHEYDNSTRITGV